MQLKITPIKRDQKIGWVHETTNEEEAKCREDVGSRDERGRNRTLERELLSTQPVSRFMWQATSSFSLSNSRGRIQFFRQKSGLSSMPARSFWITY